ncbi:hypothetical protein AB0M20_33745 [Actinoplanes sp. NPDC051633]|uniref:hypothetical protein n=1 Tax=Actinoplanes sp. NPDC051633 TaxID=3155670 RepID=UPI0034492985
MRRRMLLAGAAGVTAAVVAPGPASATTDPAGRRLLLVGANPGVSLFAGDELTAYASVWVVRWSEYGAGRAIVLWHDGTVRVMTTDRDLGYWLSQHFTRNFPEVAGVPWPEPEVQRANVDVGLDLATGLDARARDVRVRMTGVLQRRTFSTDDFDLGGTAHSLSLVLAPMNTARITIGGRALPGEVQLGGTPERPSSSAFLAEAEVWRV